MLSGMRFYLFLIHLHFLMTYTLTNTTVKDNDKALKKPPEINLRVVIFFIYLLTDNRINARFKASSASCSS